MQRTIRRRERTGDAIRRITACALLGIWVTPGFSQLGVETVPVLTDLGELPAAKLSASDRYVEWFRPFAVERAALSPDGAHFAYSLREGKEMRVVIFPTEAGRSLPVKIEVMSDDDANTDMRATGRAPILARISWMQWVTGNRLVLATNRRVIYSQGSSGRSSFVSMPGDIIAFDADGGNAKSLVSPLDLPVTLMQPSITVQRSPVMVGLSPKKMSAVVFTARHFEAGAFFVEYFELDVNSGKFTVEGDFVQERSGDYLSDREGRARIGVKPTITEKGPFRYEIFKGSFPEIKKRTLDQLVTGAGAEGFTFSHETFWGERAMPVAFGVDPEVVYVASNVGRNTYGIYGLNLMTGERTDVAVKDPAFDLARVRPDGLGMGELVFDRYEGGLAGVRPVLAKGTHWLQPFLETVQQEIDGALPDTDNRILEWDEAQRTFLVETRAPSEPGGFFVYDSEARKLRELVRRAPGLEGKRAHRVVEFTCPAPNGLTLSGLLTLPNKSRTKLAPLVVLTPDTPFGTVPQTFDREAQALAEMGLAVLRVNMRGAEGFGRRQLEALHEGREGGQAEDLLAAVDHVAAHFPVSPRRVAVMGREYGGYLGLKTAQLHPGRIRCVVAADAVVDWGEQVESIDRDTAGMRSFWKDAEQRKAASFWNRVDEFKAAVLFLSQRLVADNPRPDRNLEDVRRLQRLLKRQGLTADRVTLDSRYLGLNPEDKSAVFRRIEEFFNLHLYTYSVGEGETKVLEDN